MTRRTSTNGAEALVATLEDLGVRCVFGLPGTQNVELFEALRRSGARTVLAGSEAAAGFMANGWFRASGHPAVFVAIPGPGFIWSLPPLAEASLDSAAVLSTEPVELTALATESMGSLRSPHAARSPLPAPTSPTVTPRRTPA